MYFWLVMTLPFQGEFTLQSVQKLLTSKNFKFDCWSKFDKLWHATQWQDVDSNIVLNLCQTQYMRYDVYFTIIPVDLSDFTLIWQLNRCYLARLNSIQHLNKQSFYSQA